MCLFLWACHHMSKPHQQLSELMRTKLMKMQFMKTSSFMRQQQCLLEPALSVVYDQQMHSAAMAPSM